MTATTTDYPTSELTAKVGGEKHVIIIWPLMPKKKQNAFDSLQGQGVKLLANEIGTPGMKLQTEWALAAVKSWKKEGDVEVAATAKRDALEEYSALRDKIIEIGEKLNTRWNMGLEFEEKNS